MASIKTEAQRMLDTARDSIGWIVVWKEGRSWHCEDMYPDVVDLHGLNLTFDADDLQRLQEIRSTDPMAIIVNSWYHNLGGVKCISRDDLANCLQWHYRNGTYKVDDALAIN